MSTPLPSYLTRVTRYDSTHYGSVVVNPHEHAQLEVAGGLVFFVGSAGAALAMISFILGVPVVLPLILATLGVSFALLFRGARQKRREQSACLVCHKQSVTVPTHTIGHLGALHFQAKLFRTTLQDSTASLEARELARSAEDLLRTYEDVLHAWGNLLQQGSVDPQQEKALEKKADRLSRAVLAHHETLVERLDTDMAQEKGPPSPEHSPDFVLGVASQTAEYSQETLRRTQAKLASDKAALREANSAPSVASLLQGHAPDKKGRWLRS